MDGVPKSNGLTFKLLETAGFSLRGFFNVTLYTFSIAPDFLTACPVTVFSAVFFFRDIFAFGVTS